MTRIIAIIVLILVVVLGGWYILSHQNFTSTLPSTETTSPTSTTSTATQTTTTAAISTSTVAADIVGTWQSTDDPNYTIEVGANGTWKDTYGSGSGATQAGTFDLFTSENPDPDFTGVLQPGVVYVKVVEGATTAYFSVLSASEDSLQLNYLDEDETLSFTRVSS